MLDEETANLEECLGAACRHGHIEIAELLIAHGAADYNWGLDQACVGGRSEAAALMIARGATNLQECLEMAYRNGYIDKDAEDWKSIRNLLV
jgi:hypothetical protein